MTTTSPSGKRHALICRMLAVHRFRMDRRERCTGTRAGAALRMLKVTLWRFALVLVARMPDLAKYPGRTNGRGDQCTQPALMRT
ncbi:hypothetical protein FRAHR75_1000001 [Frankia sp. Hr75.2]|nr:hypothetical protein FRAHR75_1000001 [Frankia sp. Hr75.2]